MTKNEFFLQAMLQMAANPKYVNVEKSEDDQNLSATVLNTDEIAMDAERLTIMAEKYNCSFDEEQDGPTYCNNEHLSDIAHNINEHIEKLDAIADALEFFIEMKK